jgi:hypothetical protein
MKNLKTHGEVAISNETRQLKEEDSQVLWFTPAIPATWEAEIGRIIEWIKMKCAYRGDIWRNSFEH